MVSVLACKRCGLAIRQCRHPLQGHSTSKGAGQLTLSSEVVVVSESALPPLLPAS